MFDRVQLTRLFCLALALLILAACSEAATPAPSTTAAEAAAAEECGPVAAGDTLTDSTDLGTCGDGLEGLGLNLNAAVAAPAADTLPTLVPVEQVAALLESKDVLILDVREASAFSQAHIADALSVPLLDLPKRLDDIPTDKTLIITCTYGDMSERAEVFLESRGYENLHRMQGGMVAWEAADLPLIAN